MTQARIESRGIAEDARGDCAETTNYSLTRRYFLRGAGTVIVGTSVLGGMAGQALAQTATEASAKGQVFADSEAVYGTLGPMLAALAQSGGLGADLRQLDKTVLLEMTEPNARIYLALSPEGAEIEYGSSSATPQTTLYMPANTAHELFVGATNWSTATHEQRLVLRGRYDDLAALAPRLHFATPVLYRGMLIEAGRSDLVPE